MKFACKLYTQFYDDVLVNQKLMYIKCTQNLYKMYAKFKQTFVHLLYAKPVTYSGCLGNWYTSLGAQIFCTQKTFFLFPVALQQKIHGSSNQ